MVEDAPQDKAWSREMRERITNSQEIAAACDRLLQERCVATSDAWYTIHSLRIDTGDWLERCEYAVAMFERMYDGATTADADTAARLLLGAAILEAIDARDRVARLLAGRLDVGADQLAIEAANTVIADGRLGVAADTA